MLARSNFGLPYLETIDCGYTATTYTYAMHIFLVSSTLDAYALLSHSVF
jgi:hypothetical protein